jgi:hypothetical protein
MEVDPAQACTPQVMGFEQVMDIGIAGNSCVRQRRQIGEGRRSMLKVPNGNLSDHKRMYTSKPVVEQLHQPGLGRTKVIGPDGGVDQCH